MKTNLRSKTWTFILYPESMPENWLDLLEESQYQVAISPLHDKDVYTHDVKDKDGVVVASSGELKKAHYHVIIKSNSSLTYTSVCHLCVEALGGTIPQVVYSNVSLFSYLTHDNNKDKAPYDKSDITLLNNFDLSTKSDSITHILDIVNSQGIYRFDELIDYLASYDVEVLNYAISNSYPLIRYMQGKEVRTIRNRSIDAEVESAFNWQRMDAIVKLAEASEPPIDATTLFWLTQFMNN